MRAIVVVAVLQLAATTRAEEPMIVAHRGAVRDAPENTLPAFRLAWEQGADAIEGDFHLTRDGAVVCIHVVILCFNANVLRELKAKAPQFKALWLCSFKQDRSGTSTPALETVLTTLALIKADGLSSNPSIPETFIEAITTKGYEWHVWTVDDLKTATRMKRLGALSITSNAPGYIRTSLAHPE